MSIQKVSERGQAIILITLAMVALLGFTALAVDGSMVFADRRHIQSVADSASLAGVAAAANVFNTKNITANNWDCSDADVVKAIKSARVETIRRARNNFTIMDEDIDDRHGVEVSCSQSGKYLDVNVRLVHETETAFMQLVSGAPLTNEVTAVSRVYAEAGETIDYTIMTLNKSDCSSSQKYGALFSNDASGFRYVYVCGGGVFSNGCLGGDGAFDLYVKAKNGTGATSCSSKSTLSNSIFYGQHFTKTLFSQAPADRSTEVAEAIKVNAFALPSPAEASKACGAFPEPKKTTQVSTELCQLPETPAQICSRSGANSVSASNWSNKNITLNSGLYCVTGDVTFGSANTFKTNGAVTIVFLSGGLTCNGCTIKLASPQVGSGSGLAEDGVLFYSLATANWKIKPKTGSYLKGSVFIPKASITFETTASNINYTTQVCAYNFHDKGTQTSTYVWEDSYRYNGAPQIELHK